MNKDTVMQKLEEHDERFDVLAENVLTKQDAKQFATKVDLADMRDTILEALDHQTGLMEKTNVELLALAHAS